MPKSPTDLLNPDRVNVPPKSDADKHPAPVIFVVKELLTPDGEKLEILTRSNTAMARAVRLQGIWSHIRDNNRSGKEIHYVSETVEQTKRIAVSLNGRARDELISAIEKGGELPPEYYSPNVMNRAFSFKNE